MIKLGRNILSNQVQHSLNRTVNELGSVAQRLSSGQRINRAADDAAGLAISSSLNVDRRVYNQAIKNLNDGASLVNIADAALNELTNVVIRIEELAQQASNGTFSASQRESLQKEATALQNEVNRIINSTTFNGQNILTGTGSAASLQGGFGTDAMLKLQIGATQLLGGIQGFAGGTTRVSTTSSGGQIAAGIDPFSISMSADGRYILFSSDDDNIVAGDTNGQIDIFRKDLFTGEVIRVSTSSSGAEGDNTSNGASISADGRYVVFQSAATNLVAGDTNGQIDIFRKDLFTGEVIRVSTSSSGTEGNNTSFGASISADGRYVVFSSAANNLVAGDTNGVTDVFRKDLFTGEIIRVNTSNSGSQSNYEANTASISADGRYVVFQSDANNLVAGDTNGTGDIFRKDLLTGEIIRVSTSSTGTESNSYAENAKISADGRYVVFTSSASNLVAGDNNGLIDVFRKDLLTGEIIRVSTNSNGEEGSGGADGSTGQLSISADGRYVVFNSDSGNLAEGDSNGVLDLFRKDLVTGETIRISLATDGTEGNNLSAFSAMSADGRNVVFLSAADNLTSGDSNGNYDLFLRDLTRTGMQEMSGMVIANQAAARTTLTLAKNYREELTQYRSQLGATSSRLTTFLSTLDSTQLNYQAASARITDADIANESAKLTALKIKQQISASLLAQANNSTNIALELLKA